MAKRLIMQTYIIILEECTIIIFLAQICSRQYRLISVKNRVAQTIFLCNDDVVILYGIIIYDQSQTKKAAVREFTAGFELWQNIKNETIWTSSSIQP